MTARLSSFNWGNFFKQGAGRIREGGHRPAAAGVRAGDALGEDAHRVLQGWQTPRPIRAKAVRLPRVRVSGAFDPDQGRQTLRRLQPGYQSRRRKAHPTGDAGLAPEPRGGTDLDGVGRVDQPQSARVDQLLWGVLPL